MKWIKASERPKKDGWKIIKHNDDGTGGTRYFNIQSNKWWQDSGLYDWDGDEEFEWLDESEQLLTPEELKQSGGIDPCELLLDYKKYVENCIAVNQMPLTFLGWQI